MQSETIPGMKEVSDVIRSYTYPLLQPDGNGRPAVFASCIFLQVDESAYLVTVGFIRAHVRFKGSLRNEKGD